MVVSIYDFNLQVCSAIRDCGNTISLLLPKCSAMYSIQSFPPANIFPPSTTIVSPLTCPAALEHKNTTIPAMSSGRPRRPLGFCLANFSSPPDLPIKPDAILEGKKPGAMPLTNMFLGPNSTAKFRAKWSTAAFEAE
jgi:hypothetical protein